MHVSPHVRRAALLFAISAISTACTYTPTPEPIALAPGLLDGMHASKGVALINAQTSTQTVQIGDAGLGRKVDANYRQWTDSAIDLLRKEFASAGIGTSDTSPKSLKIAISDAAMTTGGWGFRCIVHVAVELGDGHTATFEGSRAGGLLTTVCDKSITESVSTMLEDATVRAYIAD